MLLVVFTTEKVQIDANVVASSPLTKAGVTTVSIVAILLVLFEDAIFHSRLASY
jgi:hypothetical protein